MQITIPDYYKEFSCIAGDCPDTCCAGWQIVIDPKSLKKYHHTRGVFGGRLHNEVNWKENTFRQYDRRCAFLNEANLCDMYSEAGKDMLCRTCRTYPRHVEEFEGLREISLSLSCPEAALIILQKKEKTQFISVEKEMKEELYDDFDYLFFTSLMDTRDILIQIVQNREIPMSLRLWKLLACAHDFQLCVDKGELYKWEEIRERHTETGLGNKFISKVHNWINTEDKPEELFKEMWKTLVPQMEILQPDWREFLKMNLTEILAGDDNFYKQAHRDFLAACPDWKIQKEQLLVYWIFTYFCGAVYDGNLFAKMKLAVISTLFIQQLSVGCYLKSGRNFSTENLIQICYRYSRELEHSDLNLNKMEELIEKEKIFSFKNLLLVSASSPHL